jgi:hypothetical protein
MIFNEIKKYLRDAPANFSSRNSGLIKNQLGKLKEQAVKINDQSLAKTIWCFEEILKIQDKYIAAFNQLKTAKYYEAWCVFEQVELGMQFLAPHFDDSAAEYHLRFIEKHISQYQSLYPYKYFFSPEMVKHEITCSICNKPISIHKPCGHRVGEIYDGKMCARIVSNMEVLGMALVQQPSQKYSVPFITDPQTGNTVDHYDYSLVKYLIQRLNSPFHTWDIHWTKMRHPHSRFSHVGRNDPCPCESGIKYKKCCLPMGGVLRPHCEFKFSVMPPKELLTIEYCN